jgi:hypothetical protein
MPMIDGGAWVELMRAELRRLGIITAREGRIRYKKLPPGWEKLRITKEWYQPEPEDRRMYLFEIRITTSDGYVGRKVTAPSAAHVIAHLAEEDEEFLTDPTIQSIEVKRA